MSNTILTPQIIANEALMVLQSNLVMANLVHRDYSKEFVKVGDTITVRKPAKFVAKNFTGQTSAQDITEGSVTVKMDRFRDITVNVGAKELTLDIKDFSSQVITPAMQAIAQAIDADLLAVGISKAGKKATVSSTPVISDIAGVGKALDMSKAPRNYQLFYEKNDGAGTASVIIKGIGNYAGTKKTFFKITAKQLADKEGVLGDNISILPIENVWYNGYAQKLKVHIVDGEKVLNEGVDYTLKYKNNTKPGTATVTITGKKNYSGKTTRTFVIDSWDFEDLSISFSEVTYNGKAQKPTPQFMLNGENLNLKPGTVYKITYSNNKDVGYAKAVITGARDYANVKPVTLCFYINKLDIEDAVVGNVSNQTYKGTWVKPIPKVKVGGLTLKHNKDFTVNYFGNGKKGEATLIISGIGNFEGTCEKKFIIQ
ncbi:MAG: P22 phage major capsid protein family protein [Lachnospiraceae bacterium]|nr:P22 phage major capsid protein family protein [Lachnospiraceae bacterium]